MIKVLNLDWCKENGLDLGKALRLELEQGLGLGEEKPKMITEWEDLEGKTIKKVVPSPYGDCVLLFTDGTYAHVTASGEERHGGHWPYLSDDEYTITYLKTEGYL